MRAAVRSFVVLLFLGLMFLFPTGILADEDDAEGVISGSLINGTTGERVPGVALILQRYEGDQKRDEQKAVSSPQGNFSFSGLDWREGHSYVLQAVYKDVEYYSAMVVFDDQKREISFDMTVYDTTDSDQEISVVMHHVVTERKEGALWVRELMIVENHGNKAYVGAREIAPDKKETLRISLPARAQELQLLRGLMSCCIVELQDGFADTMDIKPGKKEILFAYKIDYGASSIDLRKRVSLRTDSLNFFIPDQGIRAKGENIQYAGLIGEPENRFLHFAAKELAKGSQVVLTLKGFPWGREFFKRIAPILGVSLMGLGLAYPLIRRRKKSDGTDLKTAQGSKGKSMLQDEREGMLRAIAELDDQLDSGQISREEHDKKRRVLKEKVIKIMETLQNTDKP